MHKEADQIKMLQQTVLFNTASLIYFMTEIKAPSIFLPTEDLINNRINTLIYDPSKYQKEGYFSIISQITQKEFYKFNSLSNLPDNLQKGLTELILNAHSFIKKHKKNHFSIIPITWPFQYSGPMKRVKTVSNTEKYSIATACTHADCCYIEYEIQLIGTEKELEL